MHVISFAVERLQLGHEVRADIAANLSGSLQLSNIDTALPELRAQSLALVGANPAVKRVPATRDLMPRPFGWTKFDGPLGAGTAPGTIQFRLRAVRQTDS
jgi:hypothetical protein